MVVNGVSNEWREHGTKTGLTPRETGSGAVFGAGSRRVALSGVGAAVVKAEPMAQVTRQEVSMAGSEYCTRTPVQ